MTTTTTTQQARTAEFLAALAGRAGGWELIELRYRLADGQRMGQLFEPATRLRRLATRAIALGRRTDVYVGCAPRTHRHGGRAAGARAVALWGGCDGEPAVAALRAFEPAPAIMIASGGRGPTATPTGRCAARSPLRSSSAPTGAWRTRWAP